MNVLRITHTKPKDKTIRSSFIFRYFLFLIITIDFLGLIYITFNQYYYNYPFAIFIFISMLLLVILLLKENFFGFNGIYLSYLILAHLGIPLTNLVEDNIFTKYRASQLTWYYSSYYSEGVAIALLGVCSFIYFTSALYVFAYKNKKYGRSNFLSIDNSGPRGLYYLGLILILSFTLYLLINIKNGNLNYFGNYQDYFASLSRLKSYSLMLFLFAMGMTFAFASCNRHELKTVVVFVLIPSVLLLLKGNRGEVLYPLAASFAILFNRQIKFRLKHMVLVAILIFIIIPTIKEVRAYSFQEIEEIEKIELNWTDPFVEMGYTIRPLVYTVQWIETGEDLGRGMSYFIPLQRVVANIFPFIEKMEILGNRYSFRERLPTMGYSVIAEAFFNFGKIGVIIVMGFIASILYFLGERTTSFKKLVFAGGITAILINNIRNAFSFVPGQIVEMSLLIFIGFAIDKIIRNWRVNKKTNIVKKL